MESIGLKNENEYFIELKMGYMLSGFLKSEQLKRKIKNVKFLFKI
jgi:hypothetical protein